MLHEVYTYRVHIHAKGRDTRRVLDAKREERSTRPISSAADSPSAEPRLYKSPSPL